jgi:hypothetical protein
VSAAAVLVYGTMLAALVHVGPQARPRWRYGAWQSLLILSAAAAGAGLWFLGLQLLVLHGFCGYCTLVHGLGLVLAVLLWWRAPLSRRRALALTGAGLAGVVLLIAGQVWGPVHARVETGVPGGPVGMPLWDSSGRWPETGDPGAPHHLWVLMDYTCPHCRRVHGYLAQALQRYRGQVALTWVPIPEDAACNPYVDTTDPIHEHACVYARLTLAVWYASGRSRQVFAAFDDWMMQGDLLDPPPTVAAARAHAAALVGAAAMDRALADPQLDQALRAGIAGYAQIGSPELPPELPVIQAGNVRLVGRPADAQELFAFLEKALGIPAPR